LLFLLRLRHWLPKCSNAPDFRAIEGHHQGASVGTANREQRLQIMLTETELQLLDDWRFARRMPTRAAAVRELLRRGLAAEGFDTASRSVKSQEFGIGEPLEPNA
jgi:hypothetical protein